MLHLFQKVYVAIRIKKNVYKPTLFLPTYHLRTFFVPRSYLLRMCRPVIGAKKIRQKYEQNPVKGFGDQRCLRRSMLNSHPQYCWL